MIVFSFHWLVKPILMAFITPLATGQSPALDTPLRNMEECPGGMGVEGLVISYVAILTESSPEPVDQDVFAEYIVEESRIQAALRCDPYQRWIGNGTMQAISGGNGIKYPYREFEEQYVIYQFEFLDRNLSDSFSGTFFESPSTDPIAAFGAGDLASEDSGQTCLIEDVLYEFGSFFCEYNRCMCPVNFFISPDILAPPDPSRGVTEQEFLDALNDDLPAFRNRTAEIEAVSPDTVLPNLVIFDVIEMIGYDCDDPYATETLGGTGQETVTLEIDCVDVCSLNDTTVEIIEENLAAVYNLFAFEDCNGGFTRILNTTISRDSCPLAEPGLVYDWEVEINYVSADLSYDLFAPSSRRRRDLSETANARRLSATNSRDLFAFREPIFGDDFVCFCRAQGPAKSIEPTLTLEDFTVLAQQEIDYASSQESGYVRSCERVVCEELDGIEVFGDTFFTHLYLEVPDPDSTDLIALDDDCKTDYNQFVFDQCSEQFIQFISCFSAFLFDPVVVGLPSSTSHTRLVVEIHGTAFAYEQEGTGFGGFCPFQVCSPPDYKRNITAAGASNIFSRRELAGRKNAERRLDFYFQDPDTGEEHCFCNANSDFLNRPNVLPEVLSILPPIVGDVSIVQELNFLEDTCPDLSVFTYTQHIFVAVDNPEANFSSFPQVLQDFFNDYTVGRIDYTCTPWFPYVYDVVQLNDTGVVGVLAFEVSFAAHLDSPNPRGILFEPSGFPFNFSEFEGSGDGDGGCSLGCDRQILEELKQQGHSPDPYPRRLQAQTQRELTNDYIRCYCDVNVMRHGKIETPSLLDVNTFLNAIVEGGTVIPGLSKVQILENPDVNAAGDDPAHDWDPSVEIFERDFLSCPEPDHSHRVYFGLRLNQTEEPSFCDLQGYAELIRRAYITANIRKCDSPLHRSILPGPSYRFFDPVFQVALYEFDGNSRGLPFPEDPDGPQPFTQRPEEEARRLSAGLELFNPFCTIDQVLDGYSVLDPAEQCNGTRVCGDCGVSKFGEGAKGCSCEPCSTAVCDYDPYCCDTEYDSLCVDEAFFDVGEFCALPCVCPYDGCYCSIQAGSGGAPTELEVLTEFLEQNLTIVGECGGGGDDDEEDGPGTDSPGPGTDPPTGEPPGPSLRLLRMLDVSESSVEDLIEYEYVNCSGIVQEEFRILIVIYINKDPCTLSEAEVETLENFIRDIINNVNAEECEPSFTRVKNVTFIDTCDDERRLFGDPQLYQEWEEDDQRRLDQYATSFDVYLEGDSGSAENLYGYSSVRRRDLAAVEYTPVKTGAGGGRRLVTQNVSGELECYCPIHRNGTGSFITIDRLVFEFNLLSNDTTAIGALVLNGTTCENATIVEVATFVVLTLPKPPSQFTEEERQNLTSGYVNSHNNQTLANCGPGAILIDNAVLVPFPFLGDDADPTSAASERRRLGSYTESNTYALYVTGQADNSDGLLPVGGGGGASFNNEWYPQSNVRRRLSQNHQLFPVRANDVHRGRHLQESALCECSQSDGEVSVSVDRIIADINSGQESPLVYSASEIDQIPCSDGVVYVYDVTIEFSSDPTEEEIVISEQIFIAECNYQSAAQCPDGLWVVANFTITGALNETRRLEEFGLQPDSSRKLQGQYLYVGEVDVIYASLGDGGPAADFTYWPNAGDNRRILGEGALAHPLPGSTRDIYFRHLQTSNGRFLRNNTDDVNCTCSNVTYVESGDGNFTVTYSGNDEGVDPDDINDGVAETLSDTTNQTFGDLTFGAPPSGSPTGSPSVSPTPEDEETISYTSFEGGGGGRRLNEVVGTWDEWEDCDGGQDPNDAMLFRNTSYASTGEFSVRLQADLGQRESCVRTSFVLPAGKIPTISFDFYSLGTADLNFEIEVVPGLWLPVKKWKEGSSTGDGFYLNNFVPEENLMGMNLIYHFLILDLPITVRFRIVNALPGDEFFLDNIRVRGIAAPTNSPTSFPTNPPTSFPTISPTAFPTHFHTTPLIWEDDFSSDYQEGVGSANGHWIDPDGDGRVSFAGTGVFYTYPNAAPCGGCVRLRGKQNHFFPSGLIDINDRTSVTVYFEYYMNGADANDDDKFVVEYSFGGNSYNDPRDWILGETIQMNPVNNGGFFNETITFILSSLSGFNSGETAMFLRFLNLSDQTNDRVWLTLVRVTVN